MQGGGIIALPLFKQLDLLAYINWEPIDMMTRADTQGKVTHMTSIKRSTVIALRC